MSNKVLFCFRVCVKNRMRARDASYRNPVPRPDRTVGSLHRTAETHSAARTRRPVPLPRNHRPAQQPALRAHHSARHRTGSQSVNQ